MLEITPSSKRMKNMNIKTLFALGLILQIFAQASFSISSETINLTEPIDFIHWGILIGVALIIPYTLNFSKGWYFKIGAVLTMTGILTFVAMCGMDFVLWAFRDDIEIRNLLIQRLMEEPSIWTTFFIAGPSFLFIGLSIQALYYFPKNQFAVVLIWIGSGMTGVGKMMFPEERIIFIGGYILFAIGLLLIAFNKEVNLKNIG